MIRERQIEGGTRSLRYLETGAGWPVILIHAFPVNAEMWRPQLQRVPDGWHFIAPHLRGFGRGAAELRETPTIDDLASDVGALMDRLEIPRAVIGGLSMGGYVAFALFRMSPERFSGLVLADTRSQADSPEGREARRQMSELVRARGPSAVADQMLPKLLCDSSRRSRPGLEAEVRALIEANSVSALDGAIRAMMGRPDSTPDLARVSCPTLVLVGDEDPLVSVAESEKLQKHIARSNLIVLPGAGHLSNLEPPDQFSQALADFLISNI